jgi:sec-independent protein translocase protein TatA
MTATTHALLLLPPAFIDGIGSLELMMIMVLILVLFGGKKLPEFARGFGKVMAEVKKATSGVENEIRKATSSVEDEVNSAMVPLSRPAAQPPPPAAATGDPAGSDPNVRPPEPPKPGPSIHPVA